MFAHTFSQFIGYAPVVAYLGPSTILPLASIIAAVVGVILMFWRYIMATIRKFIGSRGKDETGTGQ